MAINTKCNNSCIWCYGKATQKKDLDMSNQTFDTALSLLKQVDCKRLAFFGGEPTLHPNLSDFIHKAVISGLDSAIVSNGSGYSDIFLNAVEDVKQSITLNVSIEGAVATTHDKITKSKGSFKKLIRGIEIAKNMNFDVAGIITLCDANAHELTDVINLLDTMRVDSMLINFASPPLNVSYDESIYLTIEQFSEQIAVSVRNTTYSLDIAVGPPLPLCQLSPTFIEAMNENKIHLNNGCQLLFGKAITIDSEGSILLCNHLTEVKTSNINNIANVEGFQEFLTSIDTQTRVKIQKYPMTKCNKCNENKKCFGGCPLLWLQ